MDAHELIAAERGAHGMLLVTQQGLRRCLFFDPSTAVDGPAAWQRLKGQQGNASGASPLDSLQQGCVDVQRPNALALSYVRRLLTSLLLQPAPSRVLVIGLGAGCLPMALQALLPRASIDVVEHDRLVEKLARAHFSFRPSACMQTHFADGAAFVREAARFRGARGRRLWDLILLDAFDSVYIPAHLRSTRFLRACRALLSARGVLAANTFERGFSRSAEADLAAFTSVFSHVWHSSVEANRIILATRDGLPTAPNAEHSLSLARRAAHDLAPRLLEHGVDAYELLGSLRTEVDGGQHSTGHRVSNAARCASLLAAVATLVAVLWCRRRGCNRKQGPSTDTTQENVDRHNCGRM